MQNKSCIMNKNYTLQSQRRNSQTENNQTFFYYWHYFIIYIFIIKYIFSPWSWGIMFKMASCSWNISNNNLKKNHCTFESNVLAKWITMGTLMPWFPIRRTVSRPCWRMCRIWEKLSLSKEKKACIMILSQLLNK